MEGRVRIPRSFIVWAVVALAGSVLILLLGSGLYPRLVAIFVFLVSWGIAWRIGVAVYESEAERRAKG